MKNNKLICGILICAMAAFLSISITILPQNNSYAASDASSKAASDTLSKAPSKAASFDTSINEIRRGSVYLELPGEDLLAAGYETGDLVSVTIGGGKPITMPFIQGFTGIGFQKSALGISPFDNKLALRMTDGDFAQANNITEEQIGQPVTVKMSKKAGFLKEYQAWDIGKLSSERSDFPDLTDEEFANFRMVTTTGIKKGVLYRTSSPINPMIKRNAIADAANRAAGVTTIVNLSETPESAANREGYDQSYYVTVNHIEVDMKTDFGSDDFNERLVRGFRFMIDNPGVFEVNCIFGKDRTGFVIAVLESLAGATYDELTADYTATFSHYYPEYNNYTPIEERNRIIAEGNLIAQMEYAYGVKNLKKADLRKVTEAYLQKCGMTPEEIEQLRSCLCSKAIDPQVILDQKAYTYTGETVQPGVTVMDGETVIDPANYTVTYPTAGKNVGKYKVEVKMGGGYSGTKTVFFKIIPKGTTIKSLKKSSGKAKGKWKKQAEKMSKSRITGYQIQLASDSAFTKGKKTVTVKGFRKTSKTVKKLKGGKKCCARIRTYMTINGKTYRSLWSETMQ